MKVSLAIATIGRTKELKRLLESLCNQSHTDFEILIADQNPPGFLDSTLGAFESQLDIRRVCISPCGVSAARNALFALFTGEIVAFPDDDCWYASDTLEMVVSFFQQHIVINSAIGTWTHDEFSRSISKVKEHAIHAMNFHELFIHGETYVQFYRHSVVKTIGLFDPVLGPGTEFPYGCGEDTDYLLRAARLGQVWRVPAIHVFHPLPNTQNHDFAPKWRAYGRGRMFLLKKHKLPLWFKISNVAYPLWRALIEGRRNWRYRWEMFRGRITELMNR
jgi:GT2 family glycosyltransferase